MSLSEQEREALTWAIYDGGPSREDFAAGIERLVDLIVARHVAEALDEAERAIDSELRSLRARVNADFTDGLTAAALIVRSRKP